MTKSEGKALNELLLKAFPNQENLIIEINNDFLNFHDKTQGEYIEQKNNLAERYNKINDELKNYRSIINFYSTMETAYSEIKNLVNLEVTANEINNNIEKIKKNKKYSCHNIEEIFSEYEAGRRQEKKNLEEIEYYRAIVENKESEKNKVSGELYDINCIIKKLNQEMKRLRCENKDLETK
jgi:predicted RND superfamily exporter protein